MYESHPTHPIQQDSGRTLSAELGRSILASSDFFQYTSTGLEPLGDFALKGFSQPLEVYGLVDEMARSIP